MRNLDQIKQIIVHCSDTRPSWMEDNSADEKMAEITRWHVEERKWRGNGYNFGIDRDGTIVKGRDLDEDGDVFEEIGAHTKGQNRDSVGIVLFGGRGSSATDAFEDHFTEAQDIALRKLIDDIQEEVPTVTQIKGHNDYAAKACPGFRVDRWFNYEAPERTSLTQSNTIRASQLIKAASVVPPAAAAVSDVPWQTIAIIALFSLVILSLSGFIDLERARKWKQGDR